MRRINLWVAMMILGWLAATPVEGHKIELEICCPDPNLDGLVDKKDVQIWVDTVGPCPNVGDCDADFNKNGYVGKIDLAYILGSWGACRCLGDLDGDGDVDDADGDLLDVVRAESPECRTDINMNGKADGVDFFIGSEAWTNDPDSDTRADVDRSGGLSAADLLAVFEAMASSLDCVGDLTADGVIDGRDIASFKHLKDFHNTCPQTDDP